jgi:SAM-dependent methyltransferase
VTKVEYAGSELSLFRETYVWKRYFSQYLAPYVEGNVLEVGAGMGAVTEALQPEAHARRWVCLEPDPGLFGVLQRRIEGGELEGIAVLGTIEDLPPRETFDAFVYIVVVEHIADDRGEMRRAASRLSDGGRLIVLSPAHGFLFSAFDASIGHCRRYTRRTLQAAVPEGLRRVSLFYLDSVGFFASVANRWLLRQSMPTSNQLRFWDRVMVPLSRVSDPLLAYRFGKSVVGIWEKAGAQR